MTWGKGFPSEPKFPSFDALKSIFTRSIGNCNKIMHAYEPSHLWCHIHLLSSIATFDAVLL